MTGTEGRRRARGFTLPLTLALTFSIMAVAAGLTGMVTVRAKAARQKDNDVFARITLESAVQAALVQLEKEGAPQTDRWVGAYQLNGRTVRITYLAVGYEADLNDDPVEAVTAAAPGAALQARIGQALYQPPLHPGAAPGRTGFQRLRDFMGAIDATPAEEDCLRSRLVLGRQTMAPQARPERTALAPPVAPLAAGDVLVIRASLDSARYQDVLWERVRFGGQKGAPWHIHDWRLLRLPPEARLCPPPAA